MDDYHLEPTVISNVKESLKCFSEETFGPLCSIKSFENEEEVLMAANSSQMGLAGYFFSRDTAQCFRVAEKLEQGSGRHLELKVL